jgi:probable phosphoglycerate mutase
MIQTENGVPVAQLSEFLGIQTNNVAEYSAMLGALEYALEHGHGRLRIISDSELMVKQLRGQYSVKSPDLRPLYEEARRRIARLEKFEIQHVLRGKNKHADQLANEAMDRGMKRPAAASVRTNASAPALPTAPVAAPVPAARPEIPIVRHNATPAQKAVGPLRCVVRNGAIQLPPNALPEGTVVIVMTEDALRGPR